MSDPLRSHVFAVGISTHALGSGWWLPRAAEHALEFAAWARGRGVPRDQIHLFLGSADEGRLTKELAKADVGAAPATFAVVTDFALRQLPALSGDLLYIFWAGHGSISEDGRRVLFFEDLTLQTQLLFDLNDFFANLRTTSFQAFARQLAFVDACANRFEELGFEASLGQIKGGKGRASQPGVTQAFFLAAASGEQAKEGAFGAAVIKALKDESQRNPLWPPDQDAIVTIVRPQFETVGQHPVQLTWTTATGDQRDIEQVVGDLPASKFVNAAAFSRRLPVRAVRRLSEIALQYAKLRRPDEVGAAQRDALYGALCETTGRPCSSLPRCTPRVELLHLVGAALQWHQEELLATELGRLGAAIEFRVELDRWALIQEVRSLVEQLPATTAQLRDEYRKTVSPPREDPTTIDAILDELYQISGGDEPQRPVWEFLMRLADRFPPHRGGLEAFIASKGVTEVTLRTVRDKLTREQLFILSISLNPANTDEPAIESIDARLVIAGTCNVVERFPAQRVTTWTAVESRAAEIVKMSRRIVMQQYGRKEGALFIEFLMPAVFLASAPDRLIMDIRGTRAPLGRLHSVVVRLRERIAQRDDAINLEDWETIARRIDRERPSTVHWMESTREAPTIETCQGLVALKFLPAEDLVDIVSEGFPFIAWLRCEPDAGDWTTFAQQFQTWAERQPLNALARNVRAIRRKKTDVGVNLTLFWDDPDETGHWLQLGDVSIGVD